MYHINKYVCVSLSISICLKYPELTMGKQALNLNEIILMSSDGCETEELRLNVI